MKPEIPDIHDLARQHPAAALPPDVRARILAALAQEERECAADEALEHELLTQYTPSPIVCNAQQNVSATAYHVSRKKHYITVAAALVLGAFSVCLLQQNADSPQAGTPRLIMQRENQQDTFILEDSDQSRLVIRIQSPPPPPLPENLI